MKTAGVFHYVNVKIPETSVVSQMERFISVSSDWNIRYHLWRWSTYFGRTGPTEICRFIFDKPVHCCTYLHLCKEFGKGIKKMVRVWFLLVGPVSSKNACRSIFRRVSYRSVRHNESTAHVINTKLGHYGLLLDFLAGVFQDSQKETPGACL